jgi:hypothetical protein
MKKLILISLGISGIIFGCANVTIGWWPNSKAGSDEACFKRTIAEYDANIRNFNMQLWDRYKKIKSEGKKEKNEELGQSFKTILPLPIPLPTPPLILFPPFNFIALLEQTSCTLAPLPISSDGSKILEYPTMPPAPCQSYAYPSLLIPKSQNILEKAKSVGRLEVRRNDKNDKDDKNPKPTVLWGTGFMVANGVFATNCHVVAPLLKLDAHLQLPYPETLVIDFEATPWSLGPAKEFPIKDILGCSQQQGLDIAFLNLCDGDVCPSGLPNPLPLLLENFEDLKNEMAVVVGYADMNRFVNPDRRAMYDPYIPPYNQDPAYGKFVLIDGISAEDKCDDDFKIMLDTESTTIGESGAVVLDLHSPILYKPNPVPSSSDVDIAVAGVHTCCSAYYETDYGEPPKDSMRCARLKRTFHNQAIESRSIIKDRKLCLILKQRGGSVVDQNGKAAAYSCPL